MQDEINNLTPLEEEIADNAGTQTENNLRYAYLKTQVTKEEEGIANLKQNREQRKVFSYWIFTLMCAYMFAALLLVGFVGFGWAHLNDAVLIALITSTLADVIGVFAFVAKYLYKVGDL